MKVQFAIIFSSFDKHLWWDVYLRRQEAEARAAAGDGFFAASDIGIFRLISTV